MLQSSGYAVYFATALCGLALVAVSTTRELWRALGEPNGAAEVAQLQSALGTINDSPSIAPVANEPPRHIRSVGVEVRRSKRETAAASRPILANVEGVPQLEADALAQRHQASEANVSVPEVYSTPHRNEDVSSRETALSSDIVQRIRVAEELERQRQSEQAEAQYDTVLLYKPTARLYLSRARLRAARNDLRGALMDAVNAERLERSVDAVLLQGDIYRWLSQRDAAREAYARASSIDPGDARISESRRLLAVQRREALRYIPEYGAVMHSSALRDSDGFVSYLLRAQSGVAPLADESVLSVGSEVRHTVGFNGQALAGFGGDIGLAREIRGLNVTTRAGAVTFGGAPAWTGLLEVARRTETVSLRLALTRGLAYDRLRAASAVSPDSAMSVATVLSSLSARLAPRVDLYLSADYARLSDGNAVSSVAGTARAGLRDDVAILYTASRASFRSGNARYFSPHSFVTNGMGIEARRTRREGLSLGARVVPTYVWVRAHSEGPSTETQRVWEATVSVEAKWRRPEWEIGLYGGYGQDRAGNYAAGFGGVQARVFR